MLRAPPRDRRGHGFGWRAVIVAVALNAAAGSGAWAAARVALIVGVSKYE